MASQWTRQEESFITGVTNSGTFPVIGIPQKVANATNCGVFISVFEPTGTLQYSTVFGGNGTDEGDAIAINNVGDAYVTGRYNLS